MSSSRNSKYEYSPGISPNSAIAKARTLRTFKDIDPYNPFHLAIEADWKEENGRLLLTINGKNAAQLKKEHKGNPTFDEWSREFLKKHQDNPFHNDNLFFYFVLEKELGFDGLELDMAFTEELYKILGHSLKKNFALRHVNFKEPTSDLYKSSDNKVYLAINYPGFTTYDLLKIPVNNTMATKTVAEETLLVFQVHTLSTSSQQNSLQKLAFVSCDLKTNSEMINKAIIEGNIDKESEQKNNIIIPFKASDGIDLNHVNLSRDDYPQVSALKELNWSLCEEGFRKRQEFLDYEFYFSDVQEPCKGIQLLKQLDIENVADFTTRASETFIEDLRKTLKNPNKNFTPSKEHLGYFIDALEILGKTYAQEFVKALPHHYLRKTSFARQLEKNTTIKVVLNIEKTSQKLKNINLHVSCDIHGNISDEKIPEKNGTLNMLWESTKIEEEKTGQLKHQLQLNRHMLYCNGEKLRETVREHLGYREFVIPCEPEDAPLFNNDRDRFGDPLPPSAGKTQLIKDIDRGLSLNGIPLNSTGKVFTTQAQRAWYYHEDKKEWEELTDKNNELFVKLLMDHGFSRNNALLIMKHHGQPPGGVAHQKLFKAFQKSPTSMIVKQPDHRKDNLFQLGDVAYYETISTNFPIQFPDNKNDLTKCVYASARSLHTFTPEGIKFDDSLTTDSSLYSDIATDKILPTLLENINHADFKEITKPSEKITPETFKLGRKIDKSIFKIIEKAEQLINECDGLSKKIEEKEKELIFKKLKLMHYNSKDASLNKTREKLTREIAAKETALQKKKDTKRDLLNDVATAQILAARLGLESKDLFKNIYAPNGKILREAELTPILNKFQQNWQKLISDTDQKPFAQRHRKWWGKWKKRAFIIACIATVLPALYSACRYYFTDTKRFWFFENRATLKTIHATNKIAKDTSKALLKVSMKTMKSSN